MDQSQPRDQDQDQEATPVCHWHPGVETRLFCSQCGKHVCTQCMVQAPVGIRCREHGKLDRVPTYDVQPTFYARAIGVGVATAIGGGLIWALLISILPIFSSLGGLAMGYAAAELIGRSVNRKRGNGLAWVAGCTVFGAFLVTLLVHGQWFGGIFPLLFIFVGIYTAIHRIR